MFFLLQTFPGKMHSAIFGSYAFTSAMAVLGLLVLVYLAIKCLISLVYGCWLYGSSSRMDINKFGEWAVVTGATDGIGKAYCQALAKRGLNVVIVGRSKDKLQQCKTHFEAEYPDQQFLCVQVDFSHGQEIFEVLRTATESLSVGTLVNNVGISYPVPDLLHDVSEEFVMDMVRVNLISTVMCTRLFLPQMVTRNRGLIINVASSSAVLRVPYMAMYSATKAFVDSFSRNIGAEYRNTGIVVQCLLPFKVATNMAATYGDISQTSAMLPTAEHYVESALRVLGKTDRTHGCVGHSVMGYISKLLPERLAVHLTAKALVAERTRILANGGVDA